MGSTFLLGLFGSADRRFLQTVAWNVQFQDHAVVNQTVDCGCGRHCILEDRVAEEGSLEFALMVMRVYEAGLLSGGDRVELA